MTRRQRPRWSELQPLLRPRAVSAGPDRAAARGARPPSATCGCWRGGGRRGRCSTTPTARPATRSACDARGRRSPAWSSSPGCCRTSRRSTRPTVVLGRPAALPLVFAPTGFTRMMHTRGRAGRRAGGRPGRDPLRAVHDGHDLDRAAGRRGARQCRRWFQLYLWRDRGASRDFVARAQDAGYDALVLTVDTPVAGARLRDVRNGLTMPPSLSLSTVAEGALHPAWWFDLLTTEPLEFASLHRFEGTVAELVGPHVRPGCHAGGPRLAARGMARPAGGQGDPARRVTPGWSSTLAPTPWSCPTTVAASSTVRPRRWSGCPRWSTPSATVPRCYVDGGVLSGGDVVAAVALGARAVLVGRAYLYGLMAGGERGRAARGRHPRRGGAQHDGAAGRHGRR